MEKRRICPNCEFKPGVKKQSTHTEPVSTGDLSQLLNNLVLEGFTFILIAISVVLIRFD